jgi:hypothetical protein
MAIIGTIGQHVGTPYSGVSASYTNIDLKSKATANGKIYSINFDIVAGGSGSGTYYPYIKLFRINGANYEVVYSESIATYAAGENSITLTTPVNVLVGDIIGYYCDYAGNACVIGEGTPGYYRKSGNITTTTAIADWSAGGSYILSLHADIYSVPSTSRFFMFLSEA